MKTEETLQLEKAIRRATRKIGVFGCYEVTIGFAGKERVDYMTYDTSGIFRCYEIKATKADFHSEAAKSFVGHYNYYVLTRGLYEEVKEEIPAWVGIYIGDYCERKAKKQDISAKEYKIRRSVGGRSTEVAYPWTEMLKDSMIAVKSPVSKFQTKAARLISIFTIILGIENFSFGCCASHARNARHIIGNMILCGLI